MKYFYWVGAFVVAAVGLFFAMSVKIDPESLPKVPFTQFSHAEDFGQEILKTLAIEIKASPVLILGVTPNQIEDMELWQGFLQANQEEGSRYDVLVGEPMLPYIELFREIMRIDMKEEMPRLVEGIKNALTRGLRVAVIVPNIYASQLLQNNPVHRLQDEFGIETLSISISKFPVTKEQEADFEPRCVKGSGQDASGVSPLGCVVQNLARKTYKEKFEHNKFSGLMEQTGPRDFVILLNRNPSPR